MKGKVWNEGASALLARVRVLSDYTMKHNLTTTSNNIDYVAMTLVQAVNPGEGKPKSIYMSAFHSDGLI